MWHASQELRERRDGALEFRLQTSSRKELTRWILSWMPHVKVLAPRELAIGSARVSMTAAESKKKWSPYQGKESAAAYGWPADLADEEILEKLLALNLERAAEEAKAAKVKKPRTSRLKHADELI